MTEDMAKKKGRPLDWEPGPWRDLAEAYGGPFLFADTIGVDYQTVWRWAQRGGNPSRAARRTIERLAAEKGLPSPLDIAPVSARTSIIPPKVDGQVDGRQESGTYFDEWGNVDDLPTIPEIRIPDGVKTEGGDK